MSFEFYLGSDAHWLGVKSVPLFVSHRRLRTRKKFRPALAPWCLDSGAFTELSTLGEWRTTPTEYLAAIERYENEVGLLEWAAPQDWMCEPWITKKTGRSVAEHQQKTVTNFLTLRESTTTVIPALQGWTVDDYLRCWEMYDKAGVDLEAENVVGLGSVCRRQSTFQAEHIVQRLQPLRLHGFGMKRQAIQRFGALLKSSDSMAWKMAGRWRTEPWCTKKDCSNCWHYAEKWRTETLSGPKTLFGA
jgi:hypothetical protein